MNRTMCIVVAVIAACEPTGTGSACIAGQAAPCTCAGGERGAQTCEPEGVYGACTCELACTPGAQVDCPCPDGTTGLQECRTGEGFAPCACGELRQAPAVLAQMAAYTIRLDEDFVYFTERSNGVAPGRLWKVRKSGGGAAHALACAVSSFALDEDSIYTTGTCEDTAGVWVTSKAGGAPSLVASAEVSPWRAPVEIDETHIYFHAGTGVYRVPKTGGAAAVLATSENVNQLAVDDRHVYYASYAELWRVPKEGGTPALFSSEVYGARPTLDDRYVYVANGALSRIPKDGGAPVALVDGLFTGIPSSVVLDQERMYLVSVWDVRSFTTTGAEPRLFALDPAAGLSVGSWPAAVAVDETHVYFSFGERNLLEMLAK